MLQDIPEKEMKGHDILAVERFQDSTRHMVEFLVRKEGYACGEPGDEVRLFLDDAGYRKMLGDQGQGAALRYVYTKRSRGSSTEAGTLPV